jgi:hypothetical protein
MRLPTWIPIERAVAFVVAPLASVVAGLGTQVASTGQLASNHAPGASYALSGSAVVATAAMFWKWLHGRQQFATLGPVFNTLDTASDKIGHYVGEINPAERAKLLVDIEGLVEKHLGYTVAQIDELKGIVTGISAAVSTPMVSTPSGNANPASVSWSTPNDPAPSSPPPLTPPVAASPPPAPLGAPASVTAQPEQPIVGA